MLEKVVRLYMHKLTWSERLWGPNTRFLYLMVGAIVMLFTLLGGRELWTQEHRWADIVFGMLYTHDYLHPSLEGMDYYDKPLLSYWLIVALVTFMGKLTVWALRAPSVLAGLLAIWSIYRLGTILKDKRLGMVSGWLLLTTFYFVFWARTSSADMLNMAGMLFAVTWYFDKKEQPSFYNYSVFFLILAVTALCKGLVGPVTAVLAILPDMLVQQNWKKHLRVSFFLGIIPAIVVYAMPFWASTYFSVSGYSENGLYLVYRENILRYFHPFDHKDPIYTYFLYLPIYILPWAFFFIPSLFSLKSRWKEMTWNSKWIVWAVLALFMFFTLSGSRRSYYILPLVPFALLMTADWILSGKALMTKRYIWAGRVAALFFVGLLLNFGLVQPLYYAKGGLSSFAAEVQSEATKVRPWSDWQIVMLDPESKLRFYLRIPPDVKNYSVQGKRDQQTVASLQQAWPILKNKPANVIYLTRLAYVPLLKDEFKDYKVVVLRKHEENAPVAFIPRA